MAFSWNPIDYKFGFGFTFYTCIYFICNYFMSIVNILSDHIKKNFVPPCILFCISTDMESDDERFEDAVPMLTPEKTYDCVICNQTTPSTNERPILLVSLLQSTSGKLPN